MSVIVGIDIGGTFTDLLLFNENTGEFTVAKVSTTPQDQSIGLMKGLENFRIPFNQLGAVVHGTTVATNAILERKGARTGLLTTKGFRDIIEVRRRDRPTMYGLCGNFEPLIPREYRMEVDERTDFSGNILKEVNPSEIEELGRGFVSRGVRAIVVSYLHSYANPENEKRTKAILRNFWPNDYIVLSSEVLPEFREFERTSTAVIAGYIQPLISEYLDLVLDKLKKKGYSGQILVVNSNGGTMSMEITKRYPVHTILSGPAAGVVAASHIARESGYKNLISFDMGGTSLDVSLIYQGKLTSTTDWKIDFGLPIQVSMIDIKTIGAGGGSIAWIDGAGILNVGPQSAGANPGPACYGKGGREPTVTDANLLLGRINPKAPIEKELTLDVGLARDSIIENIARPLQLTVEEAAHAIIQVSNHKMGGSIRTVSIERGYDPREFILVCFGGAGPLHAAALLKEFNFSKVLIPLFPGITSALGCVISDLRHDFVQTINRRLEELEKEEIESVLYNFVEKGKALLREEKAEIEKLEIVFEADMVYEGQTHVVRTPLMVEKIDPKGLMEAFQNSYRVGFSQIIEVPVRVVNLRATVFGIRPKIPISKLLMREQTNLLHALKEEREVYFKGSWIRTKIYGRQNIPQRTTLYGPCILEQMDTTILVEPDMKVQVDDFGNILMEVI